MISHKNNDWRSYEYDLERRTAYEETKARTTPLVFYTSPHSFPLGLISQWYFQFTVLPEQIKSLELGMSLPVVPRKRQVRAEYVATREIDVLSFFHFGVPCEL